MERKKETFDRRFTQFLKRYPHSPGYKKKFADLLRMQIPEYPKETSLILIAWKMGVSEEIAYSPRISRELFIRLTRKLEKARSMTTSLAEWASTMWCVCYGDRTLHKPSEITIDDSEELDEAERNAEVESIPYADLFTTEPLQGARLVTGFRGDAPNVFVIPERFDDMPVLAIDADAFRGIQAQRVVLSSDTEIIGERAFQDCTWLRQIVLSPVLGVIGPSAFEGCKRLATCAFPDSLRMIGRNAFVKSGLRDADLPANIEVIGEGAFSDCPALKTADIGPGPVTLEPRTFAGSTELVNVALPRTLERIEEEAFTGCTSLRELQIPDAVKFIAPNAFDGVSPELMLVGKKGSAAEYHAKRAGLQIRYIA